MTDAEAAQPSSVSGFTARRCMGLVGRTGLADWEDIAARELDSIDTGEASWKALRPLPASCVRAELPVPVALQSARSKEPDMQTKAIAKAASGTY